MSRRPSRPTSGPPTSVGTFDEHPEVRDDEGDPVILAFAADESVDEVLAGALPHAHSVMFSTLYEGNVFVCTLGEAAGPADEIPDSVLTIRVTAETTVADLVRRLLPLDDGTWFAISHRHTAADESEAAGDRVLVGAR